MTASTDFARATDRSKLDLKALDPRGLTLSVWPMTWIGPGSGSSASAMRLATGSNSGFTSALPEANRIRLLTRTTICSPTGFDGEAAGRDLRRKRCPDAVDLRFVDRSGRDIGREGGALDGDLVARMQRDQAVGEPVAVIGEQEAQQEVDADQGKGCDAGDRPDRDARAQVAHQHAPCRASAARCRHRCGRADGASVW